MAGAEANFLGTGWSFPPTFSRSDAAVRMTSGEADVRQSLRVLFGTAQGERVMLATYGCSLYRLMFGTLTATFRTQVGDAVRAAVIAWEPRVDVESVAVEEGPGDDAEGLISVTVAYSIRRTNTRANLVYRFYVREGTLVPGAAHAGDDG